MRGGKRRDASEPFFFRRRPFRGRRPWKARQLILSVLNLQHVDCDVDVLKISVMNTPEGQAARLKHSTVRGREEDERPAHTSRSRLDTNPEACPDDVTKKCCSEHCITSRFDFTSTYNPVIITSPSSPRVPSSYEPSAR